MAEIDSDVPAPASAPAPAPSRRGRPKGTVKPPSQAVALQAALDFVGVAHSDLQDYSQFVALTGNMAIMSSPQLSAGHPIAEELNLSPHWERIKAGLARCGKTLVITETEAGQLSVKGDKLRALVPCWHDALPPTVPDAPVIEGDLEILKECFKVCGTLASEQGQRVIEASLLLEPNVCTSTNGAAMLQFWHGLAMPPGTVISKLFSAAVAKQAKKITGFGGYWNAELGFCTSVTVWFEGGAWMKTQTYMDRWPSVDHILNVACEPIEVIDGLFDAVEAVIHFAEGEESKRVHFVDGYVQSHATADVGAQYEVKGLPGGKTFDGKLIKQVAPYVKTIDLVSHRDRAFFFGGDAGKPIRGAIMCMSMAGASGVE